MFIKPIQIPLKIEALTALQARLPANHPKYDAVNGERIKRIAGYNGEKAVHYQLKTIDQDNYFIFHDLRLNLGELTFQIDFLLLSTRFALVIEAKNFAGTMLFDEHGQLIRMINDQQEGFPDPVAQAQYHKRCLQKWLFQHHFPPLPIDYVIIISKPSTIIKMENPDPEVRKRVLPASKLPNYIFQLDHFSQKECLDPKLQRKLSKLLVKKHSPIDPDVLKAFNLTEKEILHGVQCPICTTIPMISLKAYWKCPCCQYHSKDAYHKAVHVYFILLGPTITSRQLADFLQLSSVQKARRMLISMNLPYKGEKKGRVYSRPRQ